VISAARSLLRSLYYAGRERYCPVCGRHSRRFLPAGEERRDDACCAHCGSLERHRLLWYFLISRNLLDVRPAEVSADSGPDAPRRADALLLHIAPEPCLEPRFRSVLGNRYLTADLYASGVMENFDVTDIPHKNEAFPAIYCSHVLEHVPDDRRAMREFFRVLHPDGWAILLVPITAPRTIEDPAVTDPDERLRLFGQADHVRRYGPDYADRLTECGFHVERYDPADVASAADCVRMGLGAAAGSIWLCRRQPPPDTAS
jgi:SAM-dependent methyltransferase